MGNLKKPYFRGRSANRIDDKGRLRVPKKYREVLQKNYSDSLVVTTMNECLVAYPPEKWEDIEEKALDLSQVKPEHRQFMRQFISSAEECEFDKQGRILIPPLLRESAGLKQGEVLLAGMLTNFEIWDMEAWKENMERGTQNYHAIAEEISNMGL
jgi:MraZ protein